MTHSDLALAGLACAAVPGMKPVSVQELHRGPEDEPAQHQTAVVEDSTGRRWVVMAPLTPVASAELERNDPLARQLARHLPFKVPAVAGYASVGRNGRAAVFPYVEGAPLNLHRLPAGPGLASAVGRAVAAVHNLPSGLFEEFGVPVFDAATHRARRLSELDRAAETGRVPAGLLARWEQAFEAAPLWRFASTPVHGGLDGWAFRVAFSDDDAASGRVVALTAWGHAAVTDPAEDFAVLVHHATPAAVDSVLESYGLARSQRPDPGLVSRARLASEMRLVSGLAAAVSAGDDRTVQHRVDQLRKLDRLTAADDSLVPPEPVTNPVEVSQESRPAVVLTPVTDTSTEADVAGEAHAHGADDDDTEVDIPVDDGSSAVALAADEPARDVADPDVAEPDVAEPDGAAGSSDATESIPVVRLGDGLDERTRLHDLYEMPEETFEGSGTSDGPEPAEGPDSGEERDDPPPPVSR